ncbi:hypothetical protein [Caulobacter hibisci]|uniref:DUF222 domain-containing protein n=1 Tax=Caulobacter hibisci TaxID=2035993 RepID=A0ABS0SXU4_9CAUL|nr:hypothetical protein [Caulobacter hibisci]MBI1684428.1 hypothetical protein [Caulobacter hibisci]
MSGRRFGQQTAAELAEARAAADAVMEDYGEGDLARFRADGIWNDHPAVQAALRVIMDRNDGHAPGHADVTRDADGRIRQLAAVGLPAEAEWLLAAKDRWHNRALAAERDQGLGGAEVVARLTEVMTETMERAQQALRYLAKHQNFEDDGAGNRYREGFEIACEVGQSSIADSIERHRASILAAAPSPPAVSHEGEEGKPDLSKAFPDSEGFGASFDREDGVWILYTMPGAKAFGQIYGYDRERIDWVIAALRKAAAPDEKAALVEGEAFQRVYAAVADRKAGADREMSRNRAFIYSPEMVAEEYKLATVPGLSLADLMALLAALSPQGEGDQ